MRSLPWVRDEPEAPFVAAIGTGSFEEALAAVSARVAPGRGGRGAADAFEAGFVFATAPLVQEAGGLPELVWRLKNRLGVGSLVACVASGVVGPRARARGPLAARAASLGRGLLRCLLRRARAEAEGPLAVERGPALSVGLFRQGGATPFILAPGGPTPMMRMASERGDVSAVVFLSDTVAAGQAACRTVDELFPAAGKVGALSAEVLDEDGERVPPLAVCGAVDQGGWPSGPCGTVRLWAQGTVGLLLRRAQLDAAVCPGTRAVAGPPLRVTRCDASALLRLDGRPPREALRSAFGAASAEDQLQLKGGGAMLALHSRQEEAGSPGPLRLLQGLRVSEDGTLPVEGRARSGDEVRLHAPDRFAAKAAVERASRVYAMERSGACAARPAGCFVFSDRAYSAELLEQDVAALAPQVACGFLGRGQLAPPGVTLGGSTAGTEDPDPDRTPGESFAVHRCSALVACLRFGQ